MQQSASPPPRAILVDVAPAIRTDLQAALWRAGWDADPVGPRHVRQVLTRSPPDVAIAEGRAAEVVQHATPGVPVVPAGPADGVLRALHQLVPPRQTLTLCDATVDLVTRVVHRGGRTTVLSHLEVVLLRFLAAHAPRSVSPLELRQKVWAYAPRVRSRAVQNAVYRLRRKIEPDPRCPRSLVSGYGRGYQLVLREEPAMTR